MAQPTATRALLTAALGSALVASAAERDASLRVGLDTRGAPWAFVPGYDYMKDDFARAPRTTPEQVGRLEGLDLDVIRDLERRLEVRMQVVPTRWEDMERELLLRRIDLILNAWTPSPQTLAGVVASDPYYEWGLVVAARASDPTIRSVADLAERRVGHISDPAVLPAIRAMGAGLGAKLAVVHQGGDELFLQLGRGDFDAVLFDSAYVRWRVARDPVFRIVGEPLNRLGYHVGVRAADKQLFEKVQAAVRAFVGSEEATQIRRKWEGAGTPAP